MLGKLLKHEFKDTAKLFFPLNAIVLAISILWSILIGINTFDNTLMDIIELIFMTLYIIGILSLFIITTVYLALRFYKTMYSSQGYLTHTLPVSSGAILNSKIITALCWLLLSLVVCILSIFILSAGTIGLPSFAELDLLRTELSNVFGMGLFSFFGLIAFVFICFCFDMTMMIFASFSVGQLFHQYRIPAAVGAGFIFYIIQQVLSSILIIFTSISRFGALPETSLINPSDVGSFTRNMFLLSAGTMLVFGIIFYVVCYFITKRKLNLE